MQAWQRRHRVRLRLAPPPSALLPDIPEQVSCRTRDRRGAQREVRGQRVMSDITETKQLERSKQRWQSEGELPSLFGSRPEMITHTQKVDSSVLRVRVCQEQFWLISKMLHHDSVPPKYGSGQLTAKTTCSRIT